VLPIAEFEHDSTDITGKIAQVDFFHTLKGD